MIEINDHSVRIREVDGILIILLIALLHGLVFVYLVPPWQHYDEPNHFEYVWLIASRNKLPEFNDYDPGLSFSVLESMYANEFYKGLEYQPELGTPQDQRPVPGVSQLTGKPLYYSLASIPLRLVINRDVTHQMYLIRLVSVLIFLLTILLGWGITREITPPQHPLRIITPLILALFPGFVDIMSSINNDVGAVLFMSLSLWGSVRLVMRGFSLVNFLVAFVAALLGYFTKSTAVVAFIAIPIALIFSIFRNKYRVLAWVLILAGAILVIFASFTLDDARSWYRSTSQSEPTRLVTENAVVGDYVIQLNTNAEISPEWMNPIIQPVSIETGKQVMGKEATIGFWMWADYPVSLKTPVFNTKDFQYFETIQISDSPKFFAYLTSFSETSPRIWLSIEIPRELLGKKNRIHLDGIVLAEGHLPKNEPPTFTNAQGTNGTWAGEPFVNLIENGSAEIPGFRFNPMIDKLGINFLGDRTRPSFALASILDIKTTWFLYKATIVRLFRTFWAKFGWGHVYIIGEHPYRNLGIFSLLLVAGFFIGLVRKRRAIPWDIVFLLLLISGITVLAVLVRSALYLTVSHIFLPVGRYLYPIIIPVALGMGFGWMEITRLIIRIPIDLFQKFKSQKSETGQTIQFRMAEFQIGSLFIFMLAIDIYSIYSIISYYS